MEENFSVDNGWQLGLRSCPVIWEISERVCKRRKINKNMYIEMKVKGSTNLGALKGCSGPTKGSRWIESIEHKRTKQ